MYVMRAQAWSDTEKNWHCGLKVNVNVSDPWQCDSACHRINIASISSSVYLYEIGTKYLYINT